MIKIKDILKLRKMNKEIKKRPLLKKHMDLWLEEHFNTQSESELLNIINSDPDRVLEIIDYYQSIKNKF